MFNQKKILNKQNPDDPLEQIELHGFIDTSLQNYGACIYIRSISEKGETLMTGKI